MMDMVPRGSVARSWILSRVPLHHAV